MNSLLLCFQLDLKVVRVKHNEDIHQESESHETSEGVADIEIQHVVQDEVGEAMQVKRDDHDHVLVEEFHAALSLQNVGFDSTHEHAEHQVYQHQAH